MTASRARVAAAAFIVAALGRFTSAYPVRSGLPLLRASALGVVLADFLIGRRTA